MKRKQTFWTMDPRKDLVDRMVFFSAGLMIVFLVIVLAIELGIFNIGR